MPNWVENTISVKGELKDLLDFINLGLKNSHADEIKADKVDESVIKEAIDALYKNGKYRFGARPNGAEHSDNDLPNIIKEEKGVYFSTFLPIPDTFLMYDTTNFEKEFKEQAIEQRKKYGVVGWYDYNTEYFGCKWDTEMTDMYISEFLANDGKYILRFSCSTPWAPPLIFTKRLKELFPNLDFYNLHIEEMWQSVGYCKILGKKMIEADLTHLYANVYSEDAEITPDVADEMVYDEYCRFVEKY